MKHLDIKLDDVQAVYNGPEGKLWKLVMGEQIHVGGFASSMELAELAGIQPGWRGLDLCCCLGAGMRFLAKNFQCSMCGVDTSKVAHEQSIVRAEEEGLADELEFKLADVLEVPFSGGEVSGQVVERLQAFAELLRQRRAGEEKMSLEKN